MNGEYEVFISYRRSDGHTAGRLYDRLERDFGRIFIDVEMRGGRDFQQETMGALATAPVVVAVIGRAWMSRWNQWRLHMPRDWVRRELVACLSRRDLLLLPVLVDDGISMPTAQMLPEPLRPLCNRQATRLRKEHWRSDVEPLVRNIKRRLMLGTKAKARPTIPREVAYLCNRVDQLDELERLCKASRDRRSLVCVLPGHKWEAHDGFLRRVRDGKVLEKGFGIVDGGAGMDIRPLQWNRGQKDHELALRAALKRELLGSSTEEDRSLEAFLQSTGRPMVFTLQLISSDLRTHGGGLVDRFRSAWNQLLDRLTHPPVQPLVLWIDLKYDDPKQDIQLEAPQKLPKLKPVDEGEIFNWMVLDGVRRFITGHERALRELPYNEKYYLEPGRLHMDRFADAVYDLMQPE